MTRSRAFRRWTAAALLTGLVGIGAAGCIAVPVGGYDGGYAGYYGPEVVVPAPGITVAPSFYYSHGHRGYYRGGPYYGRYWR